MWSEWIGCKCVLFKRHRRSPIRRKKGKARKLVDTCDNMSLTRKHVSLSTVESALLTRGLNLLFSPVKYCLNALKKGSDFFAVCKRRRKNKVPRQCNVSNENDDCSSTTTDKSSEDYELNDKVGLIRVSQERLVCS